MDSSSATEGILENLRIERLLGSLCHNYYLTSPAGSSRGTTDSPWGTPYVMDTARHRLQTNMADIKDLMVDIAHASHHLDHLSKAVEANRLPKGLMVERRMMLVSADDETERDGKNRHGLIRWAT